MFQPTELQREIWALQETRRDAARNVAWAQNRLDTITRRAGHAWHGQADRRELERAAAASWLAQKQQALHEIDETIAELVTKANSL